VAVIGNLFLPPATLPFSNVRKNHFTTGIPIWKALGLILFNPFLQTTCLRQKE
jgi:hypothetical protein